MDLEKVFDAAKSHPELGAVFSFKVDEQAKADFVHYCSKHGLSTGAVMRELLRQFLEGTSE